MSSKKSAKDLAFDKERAKYRHSINSLESENKKKDARILELEEELRASNNKCSELQDWIERLLLYTELSDEDMKKIIEKEKIEGEAVRRLSSIFKVFDNVVSGGYL